MELTTLTWRFVSAAFFLKHGRATPSVSISSLSTPMSVSGSNDCLEEDPVVYVNASVDRLFQFWDDDEDEQFHSAVEELRQFTDRTDTLNVVVNELLSMLGVFREGGELLLACVSQGLSLALVNELARTPTLLLLQL